MPNIIDQQAIPPDTASSIEKLEALANGEKLADGGKKNKKPGSQSVWRTIAKYIVWQLIALLVVEMVLACAGLGEEELFAIDKELGMTHMTDKSVTWRKEGYARSYLNWDGLRECDVSLAKPPGTYRVALLGDSMVEGLQVPLEETFGQRLQKELTKKLGRPVQVINFGTSGYSTVQEALLMKRKVFRYAPDMVLLGYDARDMFENWSTPDQSLANVRPYALKLPGQKLVIDNSSVTTWLKTPRAKFLTTIGWIRNHSRIWGLVSAAETEAGFHNPVYATLIALCTQPGKTIRKLAVQARDPKVWKDSFDGLVALATPSFKIQFFDPPKKTVIPDLAVSSEVGPAIAKEKLGATEKPKDKEKAKEPEISAADAAANKKAAGIFIKLMKNTLDALVLDMQADCRKHGAVLCVQALPSRATLSPIAGMDATTYGLDYEGEVKVLETICAKDNVPFIDALKPATAYSKQDQEKLYYSAHLTAAGHEYLARVLSPFLVEQIASTSGGH